VIVGVQATATRLSQESVAAREMITRFHERQGRYPQPLAADTTYGNGEMLHWYSWPLGGEKHFRPARDNLRLWWMCDCCHGA